MAYLKRFGSLSGKDRPVRIDRAGAESIEGKVVEVDDGACLIQEKGDKTGMVRLHYIAFSDIRGVSHLEYDLENPD